MDNIEKVGCWFSLFIFTGVIFYCVFLATSVNRNEAKYEAEKEQRIEACKKFKYSDLIKIKDGFYKDLTFLIYNEPTLNGYIYSEKYKDSFSCLDLEIIDGNNITLNMLRKAAKGSEKWKNDHGE